MADITLASLILFFLALPGFIARSAYHSDEFSRAILPKSLIEDITVALIFALPLHFIALLISELLHHASNGVNGPIVPDINFAKIIRLLAANFEPTGPYSLNAIVDNAYENWIYILLYAVLIHALAFYLGSMLRGRVWKNMWDLKYPAFFRFRNYWLYRLTGRGITQGNREANIRFIQVLVELEEKIVLYSGILLTFIVDENGELLDLLLINAKRSVGDLEEEAGEVHYTWLGIPGSIFVLKYSEVKNLNLYYYFLDQDGQLALLEARQVL